MYFPTMTNEELISYVSTSAQSELETELAKRLAKCIDTAEEDANEAEKYCPNCGSER